MKEENTKLLNLVGMNEAGITTEEKPIIGTQALATCFGVLLYERNKKVALVAHLSVNFIPTLINLLDLINFSQENVFEFLIIPGYYSAKEDHYNIYRQLLEIFKECNTPKFKFVPFRQSLKNNIHFDKDTLSYSFAFDSRTGKFVNEEVYFGLEYLEFSQKNR